MMVMIFFNWRIYRVASRTTQVEMWYLVKTLIL